jgi:hypothetical protein
MAISHSALQYRKTGRKGQTMAHPNFGFGEVTAVIEP